MIRFLYATISVGNLLAVFREHTISVIVLFYFYHS